jgi:GntR family transcriptional regulator of vanillate catabolism
VKALADDGASRAVVTRLNQIIRIGDSILEKGFVNAEDCQPFHEMNEDFHALIVDAARRPLLIDMIDRLNFSHRSLPFMAFNEAHLVEVYQVWCVGHHQHRSMLGAIEKGDGFRAAAIAREHINTQSEALERFSFHV